MDEKPEKYPTRVEDTVCEDLLALVLIAVAVLVFVGFAAAFTGHFLFGW